MCTVLLLVTVMELASPKYDMGARLVNVCVSTGSLNVGGHVADPYCQQQHCAFLGSIKGEVGKTHTVIIHPNDLAAVLLDQKSLNSNPGIGNKEALIFKYKSRYTSLSTPFCIPYRSFPVKLVGFAIAAHQS